MIYGGSGGGCYLGRKDNEISQEFFLSLNIPAKAKTEHDRHDSDNIKFDFHRHHRTINNYKYTTQTSRGKLHKCQFIKCIHFPYPVK